MYISTINRTEESTMLFTPLLLSLLLLCCWLSTNYSTIVAIIVTTILTTSTGGSTIISTIVTTIISAVVSTIVLLSFYYLTNFTSVMITPMVSMLCYASLISTIVQLSSLPLSLLRTKFKSFSKVCPASVAALHFCIPLQSDCRLSAKLIW